MTARRWVIIVTGVVGLILVGLGAAWTLTRDEAVIRGSTVGFTPTDDGISGTAAGPQGSRSDGSWPEYGYDNQKTRTNPRLRHLGLPGRKLWEFDAGSLVEFPPVIDEGVAVVGTNHRRVFALDMATGEIRWQVRTRGRIASSPAIGAGVVYITTTSGEFLARSLADGQPLWQRRIGSSSESSPTILGDAIYVATLDRTVFRFTPSGREVWRATVAGAVKSAVAVSDDNVVVSDYSGHVTALAQRDGSLVWSATSPGSTFRGNGRFYGGPSVQYGRVYVGNVNGKIIALDAATGRLAWLRTVGDWVYSSAAIADGLVLLGSYDRRFYALDAATGDIRWTFDAGERISGSASVIGSTVYVSTLNRTPGTGNTFGLDLTTGRKVWSLPDGRYSPAVAVRSTILIVGRQKIYAFRPR